MARNPRPSQIFLQSVPFFPIPNAVLLPGSLLPLHVFEERYVDLVRDAMRTTGQLAIARLAPGYEEQYEENPEVISLMGLGEIVSCDERPDGRLHIVIRGIARVQLTQEIENTKPYRTGNFDVIYDEDTQLTQQEMNDYREQLILLCDSLSFSVHGGGEEIRKLVREDTDPSVCADIISAALVADADKRQRLLETLNPVDRIDEALNHVSRLLVELRPRERMPN